MTPAVILEALWALGFTVSLMADDRLIVSPASALDPTQRELLRANKAAIVAALREANSITIDLITAAMRACDHHGDSEVARADMRLECLATPAQLQADLLEHFTQIHRVKP